MLEITFKYRDKYSYPRWNTQHCIVSSVEECKKLYGLGKDCEYEILSTETLEEAKLRKKAEEIIPSIVNLIPAWFVTEEDNFTPNLKNTLKKILINKEFKRAYVAFEGDVRVIFEDLVGMEYRYILTKDGSLIEKP